MAINNTSNRNTGVTTINGAVVANLTETEYQNLTSALTSVLEEGIPDVVEKDNAAPAPVVTPDVIVSQSAPPEPLEVHVGDEADITHDLMGTILKEIVALEPETQEALKQYMEAMTEETCLQLAGDALESVMSRVFSDPAQRMELVKGNIDTQVLTVNEAISLLLTRVTAGKKRTFSSLEEIMESKESLWDFVHDENADVSVDIEGVPYTLLVFKNAVGDIKRTGAYGDDYWINSIKANLESLYDHWQQYGLAGVME